ncbi:MAG: hypothetical protein ACHQJ7_02685 [Vicinamibacteria bacterium]
MLTTGAALAIAVAIGFAILFFFAIAMMVLPLVSVVVPAILIVVSRRGSELSRWSFAAACVVASLALFGVTKIVGEFIPIEYSRETQYTISFGFWAAGVVAPWCLWLAFLVRTTDRSVGRYRR